MTKTIHLSEEAHEHLELHRDGGETFSDVVLRLACERSLVDLAGALEGAEGADLRERLVERREERAEAETTVELVHEDD